MEKTIIVGSRGSNLAKIQSQSIGDILKKHHPNINIEYKFITTSADQQAETPLTSMGGKGAFVKEIENALIKKEIDLAIHSLKDLPQELPAGLKLGPFPKREDSRDVLISRFGEFLRELPKGSLIGTSSPRRAAQILFRYPERRYKPVPIRGNVETRLRKLQEGKVDALVLAAAGVNRLNLQSEVTEIIDFHDLLPAPGQGLLGLEFRQEDQDLEDVLQCVKDEKSDIMGRAERSFLSALGGSCLVPLGCHTEYIDNELQMKAILLTPDGKTVVQAMERDDVEKCELIGAKLAGRILYEGGSEILIEIDKAVSPS